MISKLRGIPYEEGRQPPIPRLVVPITIHKHDGQKKTIVMLGQLAHEFMIQTGDSSNSLVWDVLGATSCS